MVHPLCKKQNKLFAEDRFAPDVGKRGTERKKQELSKRQGRPTNPKRNVNLGKVDREDDSEKTKKGGEEGR